jgi:hypothetical protein
MTHPSQSITNSQQLIPMQQNYPVMEMPFDIFVEILKRVTRQDVGTCQLVCRQWNQLFGNQVVWRNLLESHFPLYRIPKEMQNFQEAYKDQYLLDFNQINGVYHTLEQNHVALEYGHPYYSTIYDGKFFCGYGDSLIRIWDFNTNMLLATLEGHKAPVYSLTISDNKLFSSSYDETIKIWDLSTNKCLATHENEGGSFTVFNGYKLYTLGSPDNTIEVFDLNTNKCLATLEGHTRPVIINSFAVSDDKLFSGSSDGTIKIWDLNTNKCLATLGGHRAPINFLAISGSGEKLFSSSSDRTIKIWDLNTNECLTTLYHLHNAIFFSNEKIFFHAYGTKFEIWDFNAKHNDVFVEFMEMFEGSRSIIPEQAMDRFSRMPKAARNKIYGELYKILKASNLIQNDYWGCAEHAFHDIQGQSSTFAQKAQAIRNYLKTKN